MPNAKLIAQFEHDGMQAYIAFRPKQYRGETLREPVGVVIARDRAHAMLRVQDNAAELAATEVQLYSECFPFEQKVAKYLLRTHGEIT